MMNEEMSPLNNPEMGMNGVDGEQGNDDNVANNNQAVNQELPHDAAYDAANPLGRLTAAKAELFNIGKLDIQSRMAQLQLEKAEAQLYQVNSSPVVQQAALVAIKAVAGIMDSFANKAQRKATENKKQADAASLKVQEGAELQSQAVKSVGGELLAKQAAEEFASGLTEVQVGRTDAQKKLDAHLEKTGKKLIDRGTKEAVKASAEAKSHEKWAATWSDIAVNLQRAADALRQRFDIEAVARGAEMRDRADSARFDELAAGHAAEQARQNFNTLTSPQAAAEASAASTVIAATPEPNQRAEIAGQQRRNILSRLFRN